MSEGEEKPRSKAKAKRLPSKVALQAIHIPKLANGDFGKCIDRELDKICSDLDRRGDDGETRTLVIQLDFKQKNGKVKCQEQVKAKLPAYRPDDTILMIDEKAGGMVFKPDCAENPEQMTMEVDEDPVID
jgi:hypothetical protein